MSLYGNLFRYRERSDRRPLENICRVSPAGAAEDSTRGPQLFLRTSVAPARSPQQGQVSFARSVVLAINNDPHLDAGYCQHDLDPTTEWIAG